MDCSFIDIIFLDFYLSVNQSVIYSQNKPLGVSLSICGFTVFPTFTVHSIIHYLTSIYQRLLIGEIYHTSSNFRLCWKNIWDSFASEYRLEIANMIARLWVSAHLSAMRSKNQEPFGSRNWMRLWSDSGKNKHMGAECSWTGTLQLKVPRLLRWISMTNASVSFECSISDALEKILHGLSDTV